MFKDAVESLYFDVCNVFTRQKAVDPITKQTKFTEVETLSNQPCRLVYKTINPTTASEGASFIAQSTELLISPDINIPDGSKIVVTKQTGQTVAYKRSGEPSFYPTHQQIMLELFKEWA